MISEQYSEGIPSRLVRWPRRGADPSFGVFIMFRHSLSGIWRLLGLRPFQTTAASYADAPRTRIGLLIRGAGAVIPAFLCATLALNGNGDPLIGGPGGPDPIRVMIVDDHPIIRRGLKLSLRESPDFEVVGEAATGEDAIELLQQVHPDVILMDLVMPGMGGVRAIRGIHDVAPDVKVIVFSNFEEGDRVQEALQAGAIGYLLKDIDVDKLLDATRQAVSGVASLAPAAARSLVQVTKTTPKLGDDLTDREREVLALLVQGRSNEAIADSLVITPATVKFHLRNIRSKLGTTNRTETVVVALRHGLVQPGH